MNKIIRNFLLETLHIELTGKKYFCGKLIDIGSDVVVIFDGKNFVYVSVQHIHHIKVNENDDNDINLPSAIPSIKDENTLSVKKSLILAKGMVVEIYATGNQPLYGSITDVLSDYFIFHSPIYKKMYIPIEHLKWIIPYMNNQKPYGLGDTQLIGNASTNRPQQTLELQLKHLIGTITILNIGENLNLIGKLEMVEDGFASLITGKEESIVINLQHIKSIHQP